MTNTELAWLAGIIDGEGMVSSHNMKGRILPVIHVGMTHKPTIIRVHAMFSVFGVAQLYEVTRKNIDWKNNHVTRLQTHEACLLLIGAVMPFLFTKLEQAVLLADLCRIRLEERTKHGHYSAPLLWEEWAIVSLLQDLNKRGT